MEISEKYLQERLDSLNQRLAQTRQMLAQNQANLNAIEGAILDTQEMLAFVKQKPSEEPKVVEMEQEASHDEGTS